MKFDELKLDKKLIKAITEKGYTETTAIQAETIPYAVAGRDVLGCAQTGTGKTAAFALPVLQQLIDESYRHKLRCLVLTPTRELALQIQENFCAYGKYLPLHTEVIVGGVPQKRQEEALRRGIDILVATPGRLHDLMKQQLIDLSTIAICVLDEADRMLDMGFLHDVEKILRKMPKQKQTMLFSATMPNEIHALAKGLLHNPACIETTPVASVANNIAQELYQIDKENKKYLLKDILADRKVGQALVFTRTKSGANRLSKFLNAQGIAANAIHGDKSQTGRQLALKNFKEGTIKALVATDIAARGIDINALPYVINFDIPVEAEAYVHRIGRTGRAGHTGKAISFCDVNEVSYVKAIEKLICRSLPMHKDHAYPMRDFTVKKKESSTFVRKKKGKEEVSAHAQKAVQKPHHPKRNKAKHAPMKQPMQTPSCYPRTAKTNKRQSTHNG